MQVNSMDRLLAHHAVRNASRLARLAKHGVPESEIDKIIEAEMGRVSKQCEEPEERDETLPVQAEKVATTDLWMFR